jgi:hypothetical protein
MRHLTQTLIAFCLFGFGTVLAQQTVPSAGGNSSGAGGTVSYTVGQAVYTAHSGSSGTVIQGIQQPYEIFVVTGLEEAAGIHLEFEVYPNPATDFVKLTIQKYKLENLAYKLYNVNGSLIKSGKITGEETVIDMDQLPQATYYLNIHDQQREVKAFKIVKN